VAQLRSFFESEKERLTMRSAEEKIAFKKQAAEMQADFDRLLDEESIRREDDV
jgi:hypothetical protein